MLTDLAVDLSQDVRVVQEELLGVLTALADAVALVVVPGAALVDDVTAGGQVKDVAHVGDSLAEHDVKLRLLEGRGDLVLDDLDPGAVSNHLAALLEGLDPADVHADGGVELEGAAAGRDLGIAEHDAHLLAQLVDKDDGAVGLADDRRELAQGLGHETGMEADVGVAHVAVDLRLGHKGRDRVDHDDIDGAGPDHGLGDLQGLLAAVGLGDIEVVDIHADILGIDGIQRVLRVDEARDTAPPLDLGDHVQGDGGLTGGFGTVDLDDPAAGDAAQSQGDIQAQGPGRDGLHIHLGGGVAELHDRALAELLLYLGQRRVQRLLSLIILRNSHLFLLQQ